MKYLVLAAAMLAMGFVTNAMANGYYEFSSFHWATSNFRGGSDCGSYGNRIYVHNQSSFAVEPYDVRTIDVYTVSIPDMSKRDEPPYLPGPDGIYGTGDDVSNPNYQPRTLGLREDNHPRRFRTHQSGPSGGDLCG